MFSMAIRIIFLFQSLETMESDQLTVLAVFFKFAEWGFCYVILLWSNC